SQKAMKTAGRENPNRWAKHVQRPSTWCGRSRRILLIHGGCEARKIAAMGEVFLLTSTFIELPGHYFRVACDSPQLRAISSDDTDVKGSSSSAGIEGTALLVLFSAARLPRSVQGIQQ